MVDLINSINIFIYFFQFHCLIIPHFEYKTCECSWWWDPLCVPAQPNKQPSHSNKAVYLHQKKDFSFRLFQRKKYLRVGGGFWLANKHWFLVWCCNLRREGQAWIIFGHSMKFDFWLSPVSKVNNSDRHFYRTGPYLSQPRNLPSIK